MTTTTIPGLRLGCIADDLTGATDLANELVRQGLRTKQLIGVPQGSCGGVDAVVVALKSRSIRPDLAVDQALQALRWLQAEGCERFYFKYCSTFDSTADGNIGPVIEALSHELGVQGVVACPAFPEAGRTVYQGHLFVGDRLLNETGMRDHPLNPMVDADLVRVLQAQMVAPVRLLALQVLEAGGAEAQLASMARAGIGAVVADAIDGRHLTALGRICASATLSSGGSGLGRGIAQALAGADAPSGAAALPPLSRKGRAILAGSCSEATQRQVEIAKKAFPSFRIRLCKTQTPDIVLNEFRDWLKAQPLDAPILIYSSASPDEVAAQREAWPDASMALEALFGEISVELMNRDVGALVVAGGETSGAVVSTLAFDQLEIGPEIDPGVPWTVARDRAGQPLLLALKSGNFGSDDFMIKAWSELT